MARDGDWLLNIYIHVLILSNTIWQYSARWSSCITVLQNCCKHNKDVINNNLKMQQIVQENCIGLIS